MNFIDLHHKHVITGDLNIVQDEELRNILKYGANFRTEISNNNISVYDNIEKNIINFCTKIAFKFNIPTEAFLEWKDMTIYKIKTFYTSMQHTTSLSKNKKLLTKQIFDIQKNFVITYVDKVKNNLAFICKKILSGYYKY